MKDKKLSRRDLLKGSTALALGTVFASPVRAAAPPAEAITPQLIEAAKQGRQGGACIPRWTCRSARSSARPSRRNIPASRCRSSAPARSGCFSGSARNSPPTSTPPTSSTSSDASHFISWKRNGWLAPFVSEDIAKYFPAELSRSRRPVRDLADLAVVDRLQHQSGEARRRAQELCRPARSRNGPARWSRVIPPIAAPS